MTTASLAQTLTAARAAETKASGQLATLEGKLAAALADDDYAAADAIKPLVAPAREAQVLAAAQARALSDAIAQMEAEQRQREWDAGEQERIRQTRAQVEAALADEKVAIEEMHRFFAEAEPTLDAARAALAAAVAAEKRAGEARQRAHDAMVSLGERAPGRVGAPNYASAKIESTPLLAMVYRGWV